MAMRIWGDIGDSENGVFIVNYKFGRQLRIVASNGLGWEHVSVSCKRKSKNLCPTWEEMCFVKSLFWDDEDCVVQFHPPKSEYVDNVEALHMWRPIGIELPCPPSILVGYKELGRLEKVL